MKGTNTKRRTAIGSALRIFVGLTITSTGIAQLPKLKMTSEIPGEYTAPDSVETSIGTLEYFDGVPSPDTVKNVYDYLDTSRALNVYLNSIPTEASQDKGIKTNPDGSMDIYFSPKAPAGQEGNWLQTTPGKSWFIALRIYGPEQPWINQTWRPGEIELMVE